MTKQIGRCTLCEVELDSTRMAEHLPECIEQYRQEVGGAEELPPRAYHVAVQASRAPMYWFQLLIREDAALQQLDSLLRDVWMEARDRSSRFIVGDDVYTSERLLDPRPGSLAKDFSPPVSEVFDSDKPFEYHYDLESTTQVEARVVGATHMLSDRPETPVRMLARNLPPEIPCSCGRNATLYCAECAGIVDGLLCEVCAADHDCRADDHYPELNNTPRALAQG